MKKILLTGASGFLGKHIKLFTNKKLYRIYDCNSKKGNLNSINNLKIFKKIKFDFIFHCATKAKAGNYSQIHKGEQWLQNQLINTNILYYWKDFQPQAKMVAIGSSCMYSQKFKMIEKNNLKGDVEEELYTYGMTKRMLLLGLMNFSKEYNLKYLFYIPSVFYGPNYDLDDNHFIFDFIRKINFAKKNKKKTEFYGSGYEKRDLIYVKDAVELIFKSLRYNNQIFNLASGKEYTIKDYAYMIADLFDYDRKKIFFLGKKNNSVNSRKLNVNKIKRYTVHKNTNLFDGLSRTVDYFKSNISHQV